METFETFINKKAKDYEEYLTYLRKCKDSYRAAFTAGQLWSGRDYAEPGERFVTIQCFPNVSVYLNLYFGETDSLKSIAQWLRSTREMLGVRTRISEFEPREGVIRYYYEGFNSVSIVVTFDVAHSGQCKVIETTETVTRRSYSCQSSLESGNVEREGKTTI